MRKYFALFYEVVDNFVAMRTPYREHHLRLVRQAHERGELLLAGALSDPTDRALLVFSSNKAGKLASQQLHTRLGGRTLVVFLAEGIPEVPKEFEHRPSAGTRCRQDGRFGCSAFAFLPEESGSHLPVIGAALASPLNMFPYTLA